MITESSLHLCDLVLMEREEVPFRDFSSAW